MANAPGSRIDIAEVEKLVAALEFDLAKVRAGGGDVDSLRSEVEALRAALAGGSSAQAELHEPLGRVRGLLHAAGDELGADALPVTDYLVRIGKMLGF